MFEFYCRIGRGRKDFTEIGSIIAIIRFSVYGRSVRNKSFSPNNIINATHGILTRDMIRSKFPNIRCQCFFPRIIAIERISFRTCTRIIVFVRSKRYSLLIRFVRRGLSNNLTRYIFQQTVAKVSRCYITIIPNRFGMCHRIIQFI